MNSQSESKIINSGLNRFLSEGYSVWSKDKFIKLLMSDPNVSEKPFIENLEKRGLIKFIGKEDEYVVVLKEIEY